MGEPGGLLSVGLHGVGHNWSDAAAAAAAYANSAEFYHLYLCQLLEPVLSESVSYSVMSNSLQPHRL